ncbi:ThiF family adenylyltransferase [Marinilabilia salmonicolor]|jgi:tRNA A37 threonylcarbamoyladenosine dehydratase|uniref:tRNA A37 threonylcarbamoyladenosine dehydratase n=1 Tax=Marinilabilia salmonicolor TaxID=989 RepID=A0A2T0XS76_9BACT|nr:tRNA threonylcarbamoyladenosine dehydratase [Marinilabilia salmonicolor]PRZ01805.1 tRNA A37 threonylcarbamoyladenosine dehydratase [Marinilabilia salmonicolor]RCW29863.1 tRNA A37 threonylcarbamoyladenosine dehydratase [Marinilabilia salmonicolor]
MEWLERTELLVGKENVTKLNKAHVLVAGLGGVGSWCAEMLVRAGVGELTIIDGDVVQPSNRNRQLPALEATQGMPKTDVMVERLQAINPEVILHPRGFFHTGEDFDDLLKQPFDYVVDAIDSLTPKVLLIVSAVHHGQRLISSMGAGGKLNPEKVEMADISKSYHCKLARMVRKRLTKFNIKNGFDVVFSPEPVHQSAVVHTEGERNKLTTVGTISYMPAFFGLMAASKVIRELVR